VLRRWYLFIALAGAGIAATSSCASQQEFLRNVVRCYCAADWICKDFAEMRLPDFVMSWQYLTSMISHESGCWFYAHDSVEHYEKRKKEHLGNFDRYNRESLDAEWLHECEQYHKFLTTHYFDSRRGVIVEKIQKKHKAPLRLKTHYVVLQDVLVQMAPQAHFAFYRFFFEQLSNVMLKKLNYVYFEEEMSFDHVMGLLEHKQLLAQIYRVCLHKTKQAGAAYAHKMAYHYDRIESVLDMVVSELLKKLD
jgi:hypothetical protein